MSDGLKRLKRALIPAAVLLASGVVHVILLVRGFITGISGEIAWIFSAGLCIAVGMFIFSGAIRRSLFSFGCFLVVTGMSWLASGFFSVNGDEATGFVFGFFGIGGWEVAVGFLFMLIFFETDLED